jgi:hypothetical protein
MRDRDDAIRRQPLTPLASRAAAAVGAERPSAPAEDLDRDDDAGVDPRNLDQPAFLRRRIERD